MIRSAPVDPLLCHPHDKARLEAKNGLAQLALIEQLVVDTRCSVLRESHVLQLQQLAIEGIYPCGGTYRDARFRVSIEGSPHQLPEAARVPLLVRDAIALINDTESFSSLDRAAYALWRFNWIHPFRGGNGRTSRAIAYLILCMDEGRMWPGTKTMPSLIYDHRRAYIQALQAVDANEKAAPYSPANIEPMASFLRDRLIEQMASAIDEANNKGRKSGGRKAGPGPG